MRHYDSYFDYERDLGRGVVLPFLEERDISLNGKCILDIGCGEGGVLSGLAEKFSFSGLGIDYDAEMIQKAKAVPGVRFEHGDFYTHVFQQQYDFILLRDVLEHCGRPEQMLHSVAQLLNPGGLVYVTYTPYLSPFGGHQHNGSGIFANVPYVHALPEPLFLGLVRPNGNLYKESTNLIQDLKQIRRTWLTTGKTKKMCRRAGLKRVFTRAYLVRPDYRYKFGLRPIAIPRIFSPGTVTDVFSTCVEMLLSKT